MCSVETSAPARVLLMEPGSGNGSRANTALGAVLRGAGMEAIIGPPGQTIAAIVKSAIEEDVDIVGMIAANAEAKAKQDLERALAEATLGHVQIAYAASLAAAMKHAVRASDSVHCVSLDQYSNEIAAQFKRMAAQARRARQSAADGIA